MPAQSSRDIPTEPRKDEAREQQAAIVEDADKTEQADRERIHGDGSDLGLDKADPGAPR
jgi:hypothetical protein